MIDDDIRRLDERGRDYSLGRLESDVWRGVAERAARRRTARVLTSFQSLIMIFALLGSAVAGLSAVSPKGAFGEAGLLTAGIELTPSSLLLGERP